MLRLEIVIALTLFYSKAFCSIHGLPFTCSISIHGHENVCVNFNLKSQSPTDTIEEPEIVDTWQVTGVLLASKSMFYLPINIFTMFPNITEIVVVTALPQLKSISRGQFRGLTRLRSIHIVGQEIRILGANTFDGAPTVTKLFLPSNRIESIDEMAFNGLIRCKYLWLNNNRIETLGANTFMHMNQLWSVNLENNQLKSLSEKHFANHNLAVVDLSYNQINFLPINIVENFISSKYEKKALYMRGNLCNNKTYTRKDNHRKIMESLQPCFDIINQKVEDHHQENQLWMENRQLGEMKRYEHDAQGSSDQKLVDKDVVIKNLRSKINQLEVEIVKLKSIKSDSYRGINGFRRSENGIGEPEIVEPLLEPEGITELPNEDFNFREEGTQVEDYKSVSTLSQEPEPPLKPSSECDNEVQRLSDRLELAKTWYRTWHSKKPLVCDESEEVLQLSSMVTSLNNEIGKKDILLSKLGQRTNRESSEFENIHDQQNSNDNDENEKLKNQVEELLIRNEDLQQNLIKYDRLRYENNLLMQQVENLSLGSNCPQDSITLDPINDEQHEFLEAILNNVRNWKEQNKKLQGTLEELKVENDLCHESPPKEHDYEKNLSMEIELSMRIIKDLKEKNEILFSNVNKLVKIVKERYLDHETSGEDFKLLMISNETAQCTGELEMLKAQLITLENEKNYYADMYNESNIEETSDNDINESSNEATECKLKVRTLTEQLAHAKAQYDAWHEEKPLVCDETGERKQMLEMLMRLNNEIAEKNILLSKLGEGFKAFSKETNHIEEEKNEIAEENYELKQDFADCATLYEIDLMQDATAEADERIEKEDKELVQIIAGLERSTDEEFLENVLKNEEATNSVKRIQTLRSSNLRKAQDAEIEELKNAAKDISEKVKTILYLVSNKYKALSEGDRNVSNILGEIIKLTRISKSQRRIKSSRRNDNDLLDEFDVDEFEKDDNLNILIIDKAEELKLLIDDQKQTLHDSESYQQIIDELTLLLLEDSDEHKSLDQVRKELEMLKQTISERDSIFETKYDDMEEFIKSVQNTRIEAFRAQQDLERLKEQPSDLFIDDESSDAIKEILRFAHEDEKQKDYADLDADKEAEAMKQTITDQIVSIEILTSKLETKNKEMDNLLSSRKDLLKRCESCRSILNRAKGNFLKLFRKKKDNCDFV